MLKSPPYIVSSLSFVAFCRVLAGVQYYLLCSNLSRLLWWLLIFLSNLSALSSKHFVKTALTAPEMFQNYFGRGRSKRAVFFMYWIVEGKNITGLFYYVTLSHSLFITERWKFCMCCDCWGVVVGY